MRAYQAVGVNLPHKADKQIRMTTPLAKGNSKVRGSKAPQPGDVIAYSSDGERRFHHIAIYLGGGKMIESRKSGDTELQVGNVRYVETQRWGSFENRVPATFK